MNEKPETEISSDVSGLEIITHKIFGAAISAFAFGLTGWALVGGVCYALNRMAFMNEKTSGATVQIGSIICTATGAALGWRTSGVFGQPKKLNFQKANSFTERVSNSDLIKTYTRNS